MERIICAAVYINTYKQESGYRPHNYPKFGLVFAGPDHACCLTLIQAWKKGLPEETIKKINKKNPKILRGCYQGFITTYHRYVTREKAGEIAFAAKQILTKTKTLYSEDLLN
jgi:hypothetical protein